MWLVPDGSYICQRTCGKQYRQPGSRSLSEIIGVDSGGPSGRRLGECGHTPEEYNKFKVNNKFSFLVVGLTFINLAL